MNYSQDFADSINEIEYKYGDGEIYCDHCHKAEITPKQAFLAMCKYRDAHRRLCDDCQVKYDQFLQDKRLKRQGIKINPKYL